jgi:hypothetical protein
VAEAALQLEGVIAGDGGEGEPERVAQVVRAERADVPCWVGVFGVVPAADLLADRVIDRGDSRPPGRRDPIEAADRNSAVDTSPASPGRSCSR